MKKFLYLFLISIFACSPDNEEALLEKSTSSASMDSMNFESDPSSDSDSPNLIYTETFENPELRNNPQAGDFYLEHVAMTHLLNLADHIKREVCNQLVALN